MENLLTSFWRIIIIFCFGYVLFNYNHKSIINYRIFIKRLLFSGFIIIICSGIAYLGILSTKIIFCFLTSYCNLTFMQHINNITIIGIIDNTLLLIIPTSLIFFYSINSISFINSLFRASCSSVLLFFMTDIIQLILEKESSLPFRRMAFYLFNDIIGGLFYGLILSIIILYYKCKLYDISYDKNVAIIKYYKLLFTITLATIFIYFLFFYRTYNNFSLIINDYDFINYKYSDKKAPKNINVIIPTSGLYLGYDGDEPFSLDLNYKEDISNNKTCSAIGRLNIEKYGDLFERYNMFSKINPDIVKSQDIHEIFQNLYELFDFLDFKNIYPGNIKITGDKSTIIFKRCCDNKKFDIEFMLPYDKDIVIFKDLSKFPLLSYEQKSLIEKSFIYKGNKVISIIGTQSDLRIKLLNIQELITMFLDTQENKKEKKEYKIQLPTYDNEIKIPKKPLNYFLLIFTANSPNKDIIFNDLLKACCLEIDANSLISEVFKDHIVKDILISNIKGKLNYINKETIFSKNDLLSIYGDKITINKITQDALTISGSSRKIILNNEEIDATVFTMLSHGIQIIATVLLCLFAFLTFVFSFVIDGKKKKGKKKKR